MWACDFTCKLMQSWISLRSSEPLPFSWGVSGALHWCSEIWRDSHLFIGLRVDPGDMCPLPWPLSSFSKQNHSEKVKWHWWITYFKIRKTRKSVCCVCRIKTRAVWDVKAWQCLCVLSWCLTWWHNTACICPVSVAQDASGQGQSIRNQKKKRSKDTSKWKAKPWIIEEPNRGSNVRLTGEPRNAVTVKTKV